MPGLLDHIAFLSQNVGPRPAGTEEEQQAALYITEQLQKEAGLSAVIEDFDSESNEEIPKAICTLITLVFTIAAFFLPVMAIPALIATALAALVFSLEALDKPLLSKLFTRGVSQNVVAKYEPGFSLETGSSRRRKIILVAHYDSGKVHPELKSPLLGVLPALRKLTFGAMIFIPVLLLVRYLFFLHETGAIAIVLNVITIIALVLVAPPLVFALLHKFSAYNEAANYNASGVAVLLETARKIGRGRVTGYSGSMMGGEAASIAGEEKARAGGLVPEGAQLVYEAARMQAPEPIPQTEEERLVAAKAAIAAMTGKAVPHTERSSIADNLVQVRGTPIATPNEKEIQEQREETRGAFTCIPPETIQEAREKAQLASQAAEGESAWMPESGYPAADRQAGGPGVQPVAEEEVTQAAQPAYAAPREPSVPDWFRKAQESAKKPKDKPSKAQRSQYADALDAAMAESSTHFNQANRAVTAETEEMLRKMRDGIMEVNAPHLARETLEEQRAQGAARYQAGQPAEQPVGTSEQTGQPGKAAAPEAPGSTIAMEPIDTDGLRSAARQPAGLAACQPYPQGASATETGEVPDEFGQAHGAEQQEQARQPIVLPDIAAQTAGLTPLAGTGKQQRAPLAAAEESSQTTAKSLLNMLPSIEPSEYARAAADEARSEEARADKRPDLRASLPSLSGALREKDEQSPVPVQGAPRTGSAGAGSVSAAGSFSTAGATGSFAPVGDELLENVAPEDIYVEDADDSAYESNYTETGAFAGPGYVEMPKSRARRFFDRFRKEKDNDQVSTHQWLDVEDDFDARSAGAARGGWESFQQEGEDAPPSGQGVQEENPAESRRKAPRKQRRRPDEETWEGGAFSRERMQMDAAGSNAGCYDDAAGFAVSASQRSDELRQIQEFHGSGFDAEIWFVALGSELANNGGIKAFLSEHGDELRGSVIINLCGLGSGELSYLDREGAGKAGASSRMKRYVAKASQVLGIPVSPAAVRWKESAATVAAKRGFQSMSLMGMYGSMPSRYAQGDDVLENIEDETLHTNADFVMELIRNI